MSEMEHVAITTENECARDKVLEVLINEYSDRILHLTYTYVKNKATAEDLTQEIFIKCYERFHQFNEQSSLKTWVYRIASNHCKDYLRSWHHRKVTFNEKLLTYIPSKAKQIEEQIVAMSEENSLVQAIMCLPTKYREAIFLYYYEELSITEISNVTGVNRNTIKTRLQRARELVKEQMVEEDKT
ncbi:MULTISPECIES: sigma-70 family RNA polymerase sigma factor [Bacillus]|uniref:sigma-70 family RNA polymerase sigma factor n=1 Tax=Bacillus TaxID=1386 RepID=UPI000BB76B70|nr:MULTISPECIES: sigma-70 family RNA polymerase sigma factor [Bacillus]